MSPHSIHRLTVAVALVPILGLVGQAKAEPPIEPRLAGRAVLPVDTYAPGPPSGAALVPAGQTSTTINGVVFPTPSQPVEGFSGLLPGRQPGELLAMPDNGFGGKANSRDFLIRAYYLTPDYRTARDGSGTIAVGDFIQFADPDGLIGFPIVREGTPERWLTGGDIDPESVQRGRHGDLWVGDEFGPWILHFDADGRLLEPPIALPDGLVSPNNPHRTGPATVGNSRGIEAMAITPNGNQLVVILEGAVPGDDPFSRRVYVYDIASGTFSRDADYRVEVAGHFVSDVQWLDGARLAVLERDGGLGTNALFRRVYSVEFGPGQGKGLGGKSQLVDLAAIPDPDLISLPELHPGDVGLGDPFRVTCESIEALLVESHARLVLGCDNNFPNRGRNLTRADDNELIVVEAPGL
jgi:glycerophosphoryl diester phosphodiesterase